MKYITWILIALVLGACQTFDRTDTVGTLEAQSIAYTTQSADIVATVQAERTQIAITAAAVSTEIAVENNRNLQMIQTVSAGSTPTIAVRPGNQERLGQNTMVSPVVGSGQTDFTGEGSSTTGGASFITTGLSTQTNAADGCVINPQGAFSSSVERVYATLRALNVQQGTLMETDWYREGELVWEDSWTVDATYDDICVWFFIQPSYVPFTPGNWSVAVSANGTQIGTPMSFVFEG